MNGGIYNGVTACTPPRRDTVTVFLGFLIPEEKLGQAGKVFVIESDLFVTSTS